MKKYILSILFAVPMMLMTSCSDDNITAHVEPTNSESEKMIPVTLVVTGNDQSRTTVTPTTANGLKVEWKEGDYISLIYDMYNGKKTDGSGDLETSWQVVNLKYKKKTGSNQFDFEGTIPESALGKTLTPVYPALDKTETSGPSIDTVYTLPAGKVYFNDNDLTTGKYAIQKYFEDHLTQKVAVQTQKGNNNTEHLAKLDCMIATQVKLTKEGAKIDHDVQGNSITFNHCFPFLHITLDPDKMVKGVYPIGIGVQGLWGSKEIDGPNGTKITVYNEYQLVLKEFTGNDKTIDLWMAVPSGSAKTGERLSVVYYTLSMQETFYATLAQDYKIEAGTQLAAKTPGADFQVYPLDVNKFTNGSVYGMFYSWGNLDGYDPRVDDHWYTDNNCGFKYKSASAIDDVFTWGRQNPAGSFVNNGYQANSWAGIYNSESLNLNPGKKDPGDIEPGQPMGVGDPAAYWSNKKLHVPTADEMKELIYMQGTEDMNANPKEAVYERAAQNTIFARSNGHTTCFWVAENADGKPEMTWRNDFAANSKSAGKYTRISGWRLYPIWAKDLSDPYLYFPMLGTTYYAPASADPWKKNETRFWTSTMDNNQGVAVLFQNGNLPDQGNISAQDSKNAYLVVGIRDIKYFTDPNYSGPK